MERTESIEQRLRELREQLEVGQRQLAMLDQQRAETRDTLLRISGAIQVLEEMLGQSEKAEAVNQPSQAV
jgi:prefoldin subunit 5